MAGLGWQELVIVLVIIMIIFGAGKLPEVARSLGKGVSEFKKESTATEPLTASASASGATVGTDRVERVDRVDETVVVEPRERRAEEI